MAGWGAEGREAWLERVRDSCRGDQDWRWWDWEIPPTFEDHCWLRETLPTLEQRERWLIEWHLVRADLAWLVMEVLSTSQFVWVTGGVVRQEWIWDRCRDVGGNCDGVIDIWARFHWKSLIKTMGKSLQEILRDPIVTMVIFSHTRPIAKQFLRQIRDEMVGNVKLQRLSFHPGQGGPLFGATKKDYALFSLNDGITIPRTINPKEPTVSAYGLVDSLPTSGHWVIRELDDAVTKDSVTTPEQIEKVRESWELSQPLGMPTGRSEEWVTGTWYAYGDLYHTQMKRGYDVRLHPCYPIDVDATTLKADGSIQRLVLDMKADPVLYSEKQIQKFLRKMGAKEGSKSAKMQMYCDPNAGDQDLEFQEQWLEFYDPEEEPPLELARSGHVYILVDPARDHAHGHDYTAMWVVVTRPDRRVYVVDIVRDMLNLSERTTELFARVRRFRSKEVRYERYGMQGDIEHIEYVQKEKSFRFRILEVAGMVQKAKRIERLIPWFKEGRIVLPKNLWYKSAVTGEIIDLVELFVEEEYLGFPNTPHNDLLDALSRICDREGKMNRRHIPIRLQYPEEAKAAAPKGPKIPDRKQSPAGGGDGRFGALVA